MQEKEAASPMPTIASKKLLTIFLVICAFSFTAVLLLSFSSAGPQDPNDPNYPLADTNADNKVDIFDLSYMLSRWGTTDTTADFNNDGTVTIFDLSYLLAQWGRVDTPGGGSNTVADSNYLQFDGVDDYVNLGAVDIAGSALTLEAYITADELENCASLDCRIVSKASTTSEQNHYWMLSTTRNAADTETVLRFRLRAGGTTDTLVATSGAVSNDGSYHVAATYDGSNMRLYVDGVEVGAQAKTGAIDQNNAVDAWVGGNPDGATSRPWQGRIDDVRIWSVARSQTDIAANSSMQLTGSESGLVRYYQFNEVTGQTMADSTGSNNVTLGSTANADTNDPTLVNNIPDTEAPTAPSNLIAGNPGSNSVTLTWQAATDNVAIDEYAVFRDGSEVASVDGATLLYTDSGLNSETSYSYQVFARDEADNISPGSNVDSETTAAPGSNPTTTSLTQNGITWTFNGSYEYGQYLNGDYWVKGPVVVTDISPGWTGTKNGSQVNPIPGKPHGFHADIPSYTAVLNVADDPSVSLSPDDSLVSTVGWVSGESGAPTNDGTHNTPRPSIRSAAVLTVVGSDPAPNSFRPQYSGGSKTAYNKSQVNMSLLPKLSIPASAPTIADVNSTVDRVMLDTVSYSIGRLLHPSEQMANYGRDLAAQMNTAALVLMLDYTDAQKEDLAYNLIQRGIDMYGLVGNAQSATHNGWWGDFGGAHGTGRKLPIVFAAAMLNDPAMKNVGIDYGPRFFQEDCQLRYGNSGAAMASWTDAGMEWGEFLCTRTNTTPSANGPGYRTCCTSNVNNAAALAVILMDQHNPTTDAKGIWNHDVFFDYLDHYMDVQTHDADWKRGWSAFMRDMWDTHR